METAGAVLLTLVSALYGKHYWQKSVRHCSSFGLVLILEGSSIGYSVGNAHRFFRGWYILTADWVFCLVNSNTWHAAPFIWSSMASTPTTPTVLQRSQTISFTEGGLRETQRKAAGSLMCYWRIGHNHDSMTERSRRGLQMEINLMKLTRTRTLVKNSCLFHRF